jgi:hypothetical protein
MDKHNASHYKLVMQGSEHAPMATAGILRLYPLIATELRDILAKTSLEKNGPRGKEVTSGTNPA